MTRAIIAEKTSGELPVLLSRDNAVLAEFEANGEKSRPETSDTSEEIVYDKSHNSVDVYLARFGVGSQNNSDWRQLMRMVRLVSISDSVEELFVD